MENRIKEIIEKNYKGTKCISIYCGNYTSEYATLKVEGMKHRNMPHAAKRILTEFPNLKWVRFTGGWLDYIYSRETLKWAGYKFAN